MIGADPEGHVAVLDATSVAEAAEAGRTVLVAAARLPPSPTNGSAVAAVAAVAAGGRMLLAQVWAKPKSWAGQRERAEAQVLTSLVLFFFLAGHARRARLSHKPRPLCPADARPLVGVG